MLHRAPLRYDEYIIFIYQNDKETNKIELLFIRHALYHATAGSARSNAKTRDEKERTKKKRICVDCIAFHPNLGKEEEQSRKQKEEKKKETGR